jgi:methyl-accepting chemotaxis protein
MFYKRNRKTRTTRTTRKIRKIRKTAKKSRKNTTKKIRKSLKKLRGGNYNSDQKKQIREKLAEFGFANNEITDMLNRIDKTSQIYGTHVERVIDQLDAFHRRYEDNSEEQKEAIREWVNELANMDEDVLTDEEESQTF